MGIILNSSGYYIIISYTFSTELGNETETTLILKNDIDGSIIINMTYPENYFIED